MINEYISDLKQEFKGYNAQKLKQDLLAGLTVTAVALPLALAFGVGCGATAAAGLITAIISGLIIASLSGASFQVSGPTGAMTAILILLFQKYGLKGVWLAGAMSGLILVIAGLLKFGKIVSYIPSPVVTGFTSGIALIIAIGQIDNFFGIKSAEAESSAIKFLNYFQTGINPNWYAVLLGGIVIATMLLWPKKWNAVVPSSLVGLVIALVVNLVFKFPVAVIGEIPKTLLPESRLNLFSINFSELKGMIIPAFSIAALGMIESLLCGEVGSKMKGEKLDANRELVAQGIGNIIIPFFGGVPATAAIARSSVAIKSGSQTRLVSIFHAIGLIISMFVLGSVMSQIPLAALAGVLMVTAWRMNEWENIKYIFSKRFTSAILKYVITMFATIVFDLTQAILIGVVFASFMFLVRISNMGISIHEVDEKRFSEKNGLSITKPLKDVRVVYFTGPIFFATVKQLNAELADIQNTSVLILSMRGVPLIDTSGVQALDELYQHLQQKNCQLMLCGLQPKVKEMLKKSNLAENIGEEMVFWSADQAIIAAQDMIVA
ncbi:MAG: C4-dicarboxylic acid transporter DauA [Firmicutes bacterium ADurb.Bin419]|nr:MAG: C4-dicarboxylic acid transporter DauA [Firmicutes bacterium ADurb.Bin419]